MFSALLTNLQKLISRNFIVAFYFPMLAFAVTNALILYSLNVNFREFVNSLSSRDKSETAVLLSGALSGVAICAYIFAAFAPAIQGVLEGRWPRWLKWLSSPFIAAQAKAFDRLVNQWEDAVQRRGMLEMPGSNGVPRWQEMQEKLTIARAAGVDAAQQARNTFDDTRASFVAVEKIRETQRAGMPVGVTEFDAAVTELSNNLRAMNANVPNEEKDYLLEKTRLSLRNSLEREARAALNDEIRLSNQIRFTFGAQKIAPTRMGNIANTIQSYGETQYNLNVEVLWPRFQRAIQKDKELSPLLGECKMQLDFLIACAALTAIGSLMWTILLALLGNLTPEFFLAALGGPLLFYAWYSAATVHYQTFAAVMRSCVDLLRFELIKDLHLPVPGDVESERELWDTLHRSLAFGEIRNLRYEHQKSQQNLLPQV